MRLAHPSFAANLVPGDDRINKTSLRTSALSKDGLTSNRDLEELILIYAEAKIQLSQYPDAIVAA